MINNNNTVIVYHAYNNNNCTVDMFDPTHITLFGQYTGKEYNLFVNSSTSAELSFCNNHLTLHLT